MEKSGIFQEAHNLYGLQLIYQRLTADNMRLKPSNESTF